MPTTAFRNYSNGKLSTWSQRRCIICQRFLSNDQNRYCKEHGLKIHKERCKKNMKEIWHLVESYSLKSIRDLISVQLPNYLWDELRGYC